MENATKALLLAGSVLIAILLIAFGIKIFSSTHGTVESTQTTMNTASATAFNNKFLPYIGKKRSKQQVLALVNAVIANNAVSSEHKIAIYGNVANVIYDTNHTDSDFRSPDNLLEYISSSKSDSFTVLIDKTSGMQNGYIARLTVFSDSRL